MERVNNKISLLVLMTSINFVYWNVKIVKFLLIWGFGCVFPVQDIDVL